MNIGKKFLFVVFFLHLALIFEVAFSCGSPGNAHAASPVNVHAAQDLQPIKGKDARPKATTSRASKTKEYKFKGVGNKNGKPDTSFVQDSFSKPTTLSEEKEESTITFDKNTQNIIDGAGKTIKNFDKGTLKTVNDSLDFLGVEADSAKIRPMNGGVGLGISVKLHKDPPQESNKDEKSNAAEVFDLVGPKPSKEDSLN